MSVKLIKASVFKSAEHLQRVATMQTRGKQDGHLHWFAGVPTQFNLVEVMEHISKKMPHITWHPRTGDEEYVNKFYAVMEGQPFALGAVGYADLRVKKVYPHQPKVFIQSRKISNDKYDSHRDQYHTVSPTGVDKIAREARKYLIPYTNDELVFYMHDKVRDQISKQMENGSSKAVDLCKSYGLGWNVRADFMHEMKYLKEMGTVFKTQFFAKAMAGIEEAYEEWDYVRNYVPGLTFVRIETGEYPVAHVIRGRLDGRDSRSLRDSEDKTTYKLDELPPEIAGQVAVLQILQENQYAPRIGMKDESNIFWLERDLRNDA